MSNIPSFILNEKLNVDLMKSKVESVTDSVEIRDDNFLTILVPHVSENVFEQMIVIRNDLDTWIWLNLAPQTMPGGENHDASYILMNYALPPNSQLTLVPETSGFVNASNTEGNEIRAMVDLRMPYDHFKIRVRPRVSDTDSTPSTPTTGALKTEFVRRF